MKILFILSRFPYPLEKGDKLRAYHQIKNLSLRHEVILFTLTDTRPAKDAIEHIKGMCSRVEIYELSKPVIAANLCRSIFSKLPLQVGYFYSAAAQRRLNRLIAEQKPEHIFCQLIRTAEYAKHYKNIAATLDYMDVFSKGVQRRMATAPFFARPLYKLEYKRLAEYEKKIFSYFKNTIIISGQDRDLMKVSEKNKITVISNGVDTDYFKPVNEKKDFDILFNGNMNYPPNIESAEFLVYKILPLVQKKHPGVKTLISGIHPAKRILALSSENVKVSGWVSDIRANFARSKMLVAPMFLSIGLQNKLLEAMSMQIPCITSTLANNALKAEDGKSILVADTPEQYAKHIILLLDNEKRAGEIAMNGYNYVRENYSWQKETEKLEKLLLAKV